VKVVYASSLPAGGPVSHVRDLAPAVAACGVDVKVVCADEAVASGFRRMGLEAVASPLRDKHDLRGAARLVPLLKGADVVHSHDRRSGLLARTAARIAGAHAVHTLHGVPDEIFVMVGRTNPPRPPGVSTARVLWLRYGLMRAEALLSYLGAVVVPSHALARFLVQHGFPANRMHVIPYGVALRRAEPGPPNVPARVGTAAILEHRKGIDVLLEACARVTTPISLEIYGEGTLRGELEAQAARLGVPASFHGFAGDLRERIPELDVFVLPTRADNLPVAILEAMALALPVVATRVGGVPELVADGTTGILVEPDDPKGLADAIGSLAADPERRAALGRSGAQRIVDHFEAGAVARRMVELYEQLAA
jgi:glycosyltransferase involved in cell wall biosynthesis